jgi:sensor domain-cotaining protein
MANHPLEKMYYVKKLIVCLFLLPLLVLAAPAWSQGPIELPLVLSESRDGIFQVFQDLKRRLHQAAAKLAQSGLTGPAARQVLAELHRDSPHIVAGSANGPQGRWLTVEPAKFQQSKNHKIDKTAHMQRVLSSKQPAMSQAFKTSMGFVAVDARVPVLTADGRLLGSVGALIKPRILLARVIDPQSVIMPDELWAMDRQGRILFDSNPEEIGRNLFTDPMYQPYAGLRAMGKKMAASAQGLGFYKFLGKNLKQAVNKRCIWTSVGLFGTYWRLVYIDLSRWQSGWKRRGSREVRTLHYNSAISDLSVDTQIIAALKTNDAVAIRGRLRNFYFDYPGLYSIQWVDARGVNRLGYPPAASLQDYDFKAHPGPQSANFLKALASDEATSFEQPMLAGGMGIFHTEPVTSKGRVLGMLYYSIVKP